MGYGTRERIEAERALFEWLQDTAGLPGGRAHGIANALSNRPQLIIKRKALLNILKAPDKGARAPELFEVLLDRKIIALERGDLRHPGTNDIFAIHPPRLDGAQNDARQQDGAHQQGDSHQTPWLSAFRPASQFIGIRMHRLADAPLQTERNIDRLRMLDSWFARTETHLPITATLNQRAYEIFNDEKALSEHLDGSFGRLLKRIGVDNDAPHIIDLGRQRLEAFVPHDSTAPILVVENGDTYESLKYALGEAGRGRVLGQQLGGIVYGAGGAVCTPGLLDETLAGVNYRKDHVLYWGDIDRSGVAEVSHAREVCNVSIRLAKPFYRKMVQLQKERLRMGFEIEAAPRQSFPEHLDEVSREVPLFARWMFLQTIRGGKRIPQEIIPLEVLLE